MDNYELGLKKTWGGVFQLNSALFYADYQGFQAPLTVVLNSTTGSTGTQFLNLEARNWGLEVEAQWAPVQGLQFFGSYAYINAEITEGCCYVDTNDPTAAQPDSRPVGAPLPNGSRNQSLVGSRLPMTPEHKINVGGNYTMDFTPGSLTLGATYTYTDDMQTGVFGSPRYTAPSNEIVDLRAIWKDVEDRFTIIGYVKNATDEVAYQSSTPSSLTSIGTFRQTVKLNFPRTFGVELQYRF